jgi:hypothetical protein
MTVIDLGIQDEYQQLVLYVSSIETHRFLMHFLQASVISDYPQKRACSAVPIALMAHETTQQTISCLILQNF